MTPAHDAPSARRLFAERLKTLRIEKGFDRARYLAQALGLEENRYTRYERAEVEPPLVVITKICEVLRVTPSELFGFAEDGGQAPPQGKPQKECNRLAWRLAREVTRFRRSPTPGSKLGQQQAALALFRRLRADPYDAVAEISERLLRNRFAARRRDALAAAMSAYMDAIEREAGHEAPACAAVQAVAKQRR